MMGTTDKREREVWDCIVELEFAVLYTASWWHEAVRGCRAFVLPYDTIEWLEERIGDVPMDTDTMLGRDGQTSTQYIFMAMRTAA